MTRDELVNLIAYKIYEIRSKRQFDSGGAETDWALAQRAVEHFENPDPSNWVWRYREGDFKDFEEIYKQYETQST